MIKNELRRDPISGKWIIIINRRPDIEALVKKAKLQQTASQTELCEYCEGREHETPSKIFALRREDGWIVRVIPVNYPVLQIHGDLNKGKRIMDKGKSKTMYFNTENFIFYRCAYCSQENIIEVDISGGFAQEYVEDCQICCCPNFLKIMFNEATQLSEVEVEYLG